MDNNKSILELSQTLKEVSENIKNNNKKEKERRDKVWKDFLKEHQEKYGRPHPIWG